jgi:hypothetical protein
MRVNPWLQFTQAPLILRVYIVFLVFVSVLFLSAFADPVSAAIVPYTGWSGLSFYLPTVYFALAAIFTSQRKLVYVVEVFLGLVVLFGVFDTFQHTWGTEAGKPDLGNPYLTYHPYHPLFTVAVPATWLLLLLSPSVRIRRSRITSWPATKPSSMSTGPRMS